jgi:intraflagellar transport protein 172
MNNMAFVCWNRFLDITEAVEEKVGLVENSDFIHTDVPFDAPLPKKNLPVKRNII